MMNNFIDWKNIDNFKKAIGSAAIMWIVGVSPTILSVIYYIIDANGKFADIVAAVSLFLGGLLCVFVMKKEYHADIKEYLNKPDAKILLLVISTSLFYVVTAMYTLYRPMLVGEPSADTIEIVTLVLASTIAPVGEELIFRFGMLTLLLIASKGNNIKTIFSIVIVSFVWMVMHFSDYIPRILDLIIVGIIIGFLYLKSRNILYCIVFHIIANVCTYSFAVVYKWLFQREYILYISAILFLFTLIMLFYYLCRTTKLKFDKKDNVI